ncbi:hypothetical protein TL16_g11762 [Triparma laevis f. inornata]|uniref:C2H2-type domain-containing protein n=1 Tax=Triparma laevis f. inornata TaxID=1714386 RepID=A0A9W7ESV2_9STRA|nr:hypothetical protein TL16_g11762 [Triparma laevis f. inornata]
MFSTPTRNSQPMRAKREGAQGVWNPYKPAMKKMEDYLKAKGVLLERAEKQEDLGDLSEARAGERGGEEHLEAGRDLEDTVRVMADREGRADPLLGPTATGVSLESFKDPFKVFAGDKRGNIREDVNEIKKRQGFGFEDEDDGEGGGGNSSSSSSSNAHSSTLSYNPLQQKITVGDSQELDMSISQAEYNNVLFRQTADMVEKHRLDKERERVERKKKREAQQKEREKYFVKNRAAIEEKRRAKNESIKLKNELRKTHVLIPSFLTAPQPPKMGKRKGRKAGPWERNKNRRGGDRKSLEGELQGRYKPMPIDPIEPVSGIEVGGVTLRNRTPKSSSKTGAHSNNSIWIRCRVPGCRYKCVNPSAIEVHMSLIHGDVKESDLIELDAVGRKPSDWENYGKPFYACEYPSCSYGNYRFKSVQRHAMNVHNLPRTTHPQLSPVFKVPGRTQHLPVQFQPVQPGSPPTSAKIGGIVCDVEEIEWSTPPPALVSQTSRDIMSLEKDLFPKREIFGSIFGPIPLQAQVILSPSPNFPFQYLFDGVSPPPPPTKIHNEVIELSDAIQSPITSIHVVKHKIFFVGEMCLPTYEEREIEQEDDSEESGRSVLKELCG